MDRNFQLTKVYNRTFAEWDFLVSADYSIMIFLTADHLLILPALSIARTRQ